MQRVLSSELRSHVGERVRLAGWVQHQRRLSRVTFLLLRDRGGIAQVVVEPSAEAEAARLLPETVIEVVAQAVANLQAPGWVGGRRFGSSCRRSSTTPRLRGAIRGSAPSSC